MERRKRLQAKKPMPRKKVTGERVVVSEFGRKAGRTATGELALFTALYYHQRGVCAVTGDPLLKPGTARFHCQGSHLLPKGGYPMARLWPCNVIMILPHMHDLWGNTGNKDHLVTGNDKLKPDPRWAPHVELYRRLQLFYNTATREQREVGYLSVDRSTQDEGQTIGPGALFGRGETPNVPIDDLPF